MFVHFPSETCSNSGGTKDADTRLAVKDKGAQMCLQNNRQWLLNSSSKWLAFLGSVRLTLTERFIMICRGLANLIFRNVKKRVVEFLH